MSVYLKAAQLVSNPRDPEFACTAISRASGLLIYGDAYRQQFKAIFEPVRKDNPIGGPVWFGELRDSRHQLERSIALLLMHEMDQDDEEL